VNTLVWTTHVTEAHETLFARVREWGFDVVLKSFDRCGSRGIAFADNWFKQETAAAEDLALPGMTATLFSSLLA
jgi:hypothetical protein